MSGTKLVRTGLLDFRKDHPSARADDSYRPLASPEEHKLLLNFKLFEEVGEVVDCDGEDVNEFADLLQALMDRSYLQGLRWSEVETARAEKARKLGTFIPGMVRVRKAK